eukprot:scaffold3659_cov74-Skeletonema_dohrnii-CCMP3373.AAC.1
MSVRCCVDEREALILTGNDALPLSLPEIVLLRVREKMSQRYQTQLELVYLLIAALRNTILHAFLDTKTTALKAVTWAGSGLG